MYMEETEAQRTQAAFLRTHSERIRGDAGLEPGLWAPWPMVSLRHGYNPLYRQRDQSPERKANRQAVSTGFSKIRPKADVLPIFPTGVMVYICLNLTDPKGTVVETEWKAIRELSGEGVQLVPARLTERHPHLSKSPREDPRRGFWGEGLLEFRASGGHAHPPRRVGLGSDLTAAGANTRSVENTEPF